MSKVISANIFLPDKVYCIHCNASLEKRGADCEACGFSLDYLRGVYKTSPPEIIPLLNLREEFSKGDTRKISGEIRKFEKRFVKHYLSINVIPLSQEVKIKEFLFWLHNTAKSNGDRSLAYTSILLIDPTSRKVGLSLGYQIEPFIRMQDTKSSLKHLYTMVRADNLVSGITNFIKDYKVIGEKSWKRMNQTLKEN